MVAGQLELSVAPLESSLPPNETLDEYRRARFQATRKWFKRRARLDEMAAPTNAQAMRPHIFGEEEL